MQADSSTNRKFGGTGLGLAIIKRFTDLMQGDVSVKSVKDKGTTFTVKMPEFLDVADINMKLDQWPTERRSSRLNRQLFLTSPMIRVIAKKRSYLVIDDDPDNPRYLDACAYRRGFAGRNGIRRRRRLATRPRTRSRI